ncbi:ribosome small subunit-dependent GTPase A [Desulfovibrio aminophilus]|nr:ribosome small subunit-dependent GTPase A [Desulfovibrio aminophilus]MCM0755437.1 ribosome small subunit-dependent GTPase A [Desulfovibrio aminophilus]
MQLHDFGFDQWFEAHAAEYGMEGCGFARVTAVDRGSCLVRNASREIPAELSGRLAYDTESPADLPCVGDWVTARLYNDGTAAIIQRVFPRRTFLRRRSPGTIDGVQMIAANIDTAFIVQSCRVDFNPARLERYLVMAADGGVEPVIVLTKADLAAPEELEHILATVQALTPTRAIALSNVTGLGFDTLRQTLVPGRTCCLLGSSGVGKTTLINRLLGLEAFVTQAVSGTGEGVHTTTRRQLVVLGQGAMLVDTPGMRELGMTDAVDGIDAGFGEIAALAAQCRYADCTHEHEPGCAVRAAVRAGELAQDRYASYLKLRKESEFAALSTLGRRRKEKAFGKFIQSFKKQQKR